MPPPRAVAGGDTIASVTTRELAHKLIDELPDDRVGDALAALEALDDPVIAAFRDAPLDDEPLTPEEEAALREADADIAAGRTVSLEELKLELE
jgi:hypothetical protein